MRRADDEPIRKKQRRAGMRIHRITSECVLAIVSSCRTCVYINTRRNYQRKKEKKKTQNKKKYTYINAKRDNEAIVPSRSLHPSVCCGCKIHGGRPACRRRRNKFARQIISIYMYTGKKGICCIYYIIYTKVVFS